MQTVNLIDHLTTQPWLATLLMIWTILVLHLPYRVEQRRDRRGHIHGVYVSLLYYYECGPTYERLRYDGLRRTQRTIIALLRTVWAALRGDVLRAFVAEVRRRLGL